MRDLCQSKDLSLRVPCPLPAFQAARSEGRVSKHLRYLLARGSLSRRLSSELTITRPLHMVRKLARHDAWHCACDASSGPAPSVRASRSTGLVDVQVKLVKKKVPRVDMTHGKHT